MNDTKKTASPEGFFSAASSANAAKGASPGKPSDSPEFFRLPPPEGRSRESTITVDALGRFSHEGTPFDHARLARAFHSWIGRHPDDGRYILNNGYDWTYFKVEDVPLFVTGVSERGLSLEGDREVPWSKVVRFEEKDDRLYAELEIEGFGRAPARFLQHAKLALGPFLEEKDGHFVVRAGDRTLPIEAAFSS